MIESERTVRHLRASLENGVVSILAAFALGVVGGWSIAQWSRTRLGAVGGLVVALGTALWLASSYYRTRGLLHLNHSRD